MFATSQHAHFIGIGGIGMSGIAEIMLNLGMKVSGSDLKRSAVTDRLAQLGATIYEGHNAANVADATVVVTSSAVHTDNPEVLEAQAKKIPVIQRAEMLAELMRLKYGRRPRSNSGCWRARGCAGLKRAPWHFAVSCGRGRRERSLVPEALADSRGGHQS
jgi:hypothetical protein